MPDCRQPKAFRKRFEGTGWAVYCLLREEKMTLQTKRAALAAVLAAGLAVTTLAGCNRDTAAPAGEASGGASGAAAGKRACIILPDAASSSRWENGDRPQLEQGVQSAGRRDGHPERAERHQQVRDDRPAAAHQGVRGHAARRPEQGGRPGGAEGQGAGCPGDRLRPAD